MLRQRTGVTPNVLARVAIMKALDASTGISNAGVNDTDGQELNRDVLFGDLTGSFELLIQYYIEKYHIVEPAKDVISALIEIGVHKIGHVKNVSDLAQLN
jgi:DNA sulfur modification protein DndE